MSGGTLYLGLFQVERIGKCRKHDAGKCTVSGSWIGGLEGRGTSSRPIPPSSLASTHAHRLTLDGVQQHEWFRTGLPEGAALLNDVSGLARRRAWTVAGLAVLGGGVDVAHVGFGVCCKGNMCRW